jgi:hypothetical protein
MRLFKVEFSISGENGVREPSTHSIIGAASKYDAKRIMKRMYYGKELEIEKITPVQCTVGREHNVGCGYLDPSGNCTGVSPNVKCLFR